MEIFWLNFVETYWIVLPKTSFYFMFKQRFKINLASKKSFDSYCVWMLYVKFCIIFS